MIGSRSRAPTAAPTALAPLGRLAPSAPMAPVAPTARAGLAALVLAAVFLLGCSTRDEQAEVEFTIPAGVTFSEVTDTLVARGLVGAPRTFRLYARMRGADREVRSGRYSLSSADGWSGMLDALVRGRVQTVTFTIPEGFALRKIAEPLSSITGIDRDSVLVRLNSATEATWGVPGPGLEGYLFPDTYRFAEGVPVDEVIRTLVDRYRAVWTPDRRVRLEALEMSEGELITLASIIQAEARVVEEMPTISSVYHNRLRLGYLLQADPTVLYALGGPRPRLLYAAIDSVADDPYNTYTQPGLPPGPIGSPGEAAIEAALNPAEGNYLYFVARPNGTHVFTRSLIEHNQAKAAAQQEASELTRSRAVGG